MKFLKKFLATVFAIVLMATSAIAIAGGGELAYFKLQELTALTGTSAAAGDLVPIYDVSAGKVKTIDLGANMAVLAGVTATAAELNYNDIAVLGTLAASKAWSSDALLDTIMPTGGLLTVQSGGAITAESGSTVNLAGTFQVGGVGVTGTAAELNYIDLTTLGTGAASKAIVLDASGDYTAPATLNLTIPSSGEVAFASGSVLKVDTVAVNHTPLVFQARGTITICGDGTTVNNNTVYYGPSQTLTSSATIGAVVCNTTAAGNTTEATADAPALPATAFYPLGMVCWAPDSNNTVTFTLRSAEAAITPAISVSIADNILSGSASATATSAVASGATLAVAVASTGDLGALPFRCDIAIAY